jgi:Ras-related protein Rab-23
LLARALGCRLLRTSVKEDINVNAVFRHLAACCLAELRLQEEEYALSGASNGIAPLTISKYTTLCSIKVTARKEALKMIYN